MPIFDYTCDNCSIKKLDEFVHNRTDLVSCNKCGKTMTRIFNPSIIPQVWPSEGVTLTNVAAQPVTFYSKGDMKRYAKTHDLELGALL